MSNKMDERMQESTVEQQKQPKNLEQKPPPPESNTKAYILALVIYIVELALMINSLIADIAVVKELTNWSGFRGRYDAVNMQMPVSGPSNLSIERGFLIFACAAAGLVILLTTMNAMYTAYTNARQAMRARSRVAPGDGSSLAVAEEKVESMVAGATVYLLGYSIFINNVCIAYYKLIVYGSILNKLSFYGLFCHSSDSQGFSELSGVLRQQAHLNDGVADASGCVNDPFAGVMQTAIIMTLALLPFSAVWYQASSANTNLKIQLLTIPASIVSIVLNLLLPVATGMMFIALQYQQIKNGWFEMDSLLVRALVASLMALCVGCTNVMVTSLVLNRVVKMSKDEDPSMDLVFGDGKRPAPDGSRSAEPPALEGSRSAKLRAPDGSGRPAPVAEALEPSLAPPSPSAAGRASAPRAHAIGEISRKGSSRSATAEEPELAAPPAADQKAAEQATAGRRGSQTETEAPADCDAKPGVVQMLKLGCHVICLATAWVIGTNLTVGQVLCVVFAAAPLALDVPLRAQKQEPASDAWSFWFVISYAYGIFSMVMTAAFLVSLCLPFMQNKMAELVESMEATVEELGEAAGKVAEAEDEKNEILARQQQVTARVIETVTASGASPEAAALVAKAVLEALAAVDSAKAALGASELAARLADDKPEAAPHALAAKTAADAAAQAAEAADQAVSTALAVALSSLQETAAAVEQAAAAARAANEAAGEASRAAMLCL